MQTAHDVFLSYSHADTEIMQRVKNTLVESGLSVWTDEKIEVGTPSWIKAIDSAIRQTGCVVVIFSPDAVTSWGVDEELSFARIQQKRVFPILARGDEKNSVPFGTSSAQWVDIRTDSNYEEKISQLINSIREYLKIQVALINTPNKQQERQTIVITQQIYQQLRDYRAQILGFQIDNAANNRDALAAHIATLEAERDFKIMEIDFELSLSNISETREYFLHWLRIHQLYWHNYRLAVGYRDADAALNAKREASKQLIQYHQEFLATGKVLDLLEFSNYLYLEFVKYIRSSETISANSIKWHFLINEVDIIRWLERLEQDHIIENMHDENGNYRSI